MRGLSSALHYGHKIEEDWWAWKPEKFGDYTVKSAYRKLHGASMDHAGLVPGVSSDASWSKLWKLNVPPKVFSTAVILSRPVSVMCVEQTENQSSMSLLNALLLMGIKFPRLHPLTWASDILSEGFCSEKDRCLFITGMYSLCSQRNGRRHGGDQPSLWQAVRWAVDTAHDLCMADHRGTKTEAVSCNTNALACTTRGLDQMQHRWRLLPRFWTGSNWCSPSGSSRNF